MRIMNPVASVDPFDGRTTAQFDRDWEAVFNRSDYQVIAASYAENARLIAAHRETIVGRRQIEAFWRQACEGGAAAHLRRIVHTELVDVDEHHASLCGTVSLQVGESTPVLVRFVTIWKRQPDGVWRIAIDISSPAPAHGPLQRRADRGF
jgi:ketosteroid isomerase-like protein